MYKTKSKYKITLPKWVTMKEEVVFSGLSGIYPSSRDVKEYGDNLFEGVDMVKESTHERWPSGQDTKFNIS